MFKETEIYPEGLLKKRVKSTNHLWGWKYTDIPQVVEACREHERVILTVRTDFFLPDSTCELYWKKACPKLKKASENWPQYVNRNCTEFLQLIGDLADQTDFEKEGMAFSLLRDKKAVGVKITDYIYFDFDIYTEKSYFQFFNNLD